MDVLFASLAQLGLCSKLRDLNLSDNPIGDEGIISSEPGNCIGLAHSIRNPCFPLLTKLNLNREHF